MAITLDFADLTTETLDGTGYFDKLMRAAKAHITDEYTAGRIKGADYATVYLGAMQYSLNTALQFMLQKDTVEASADKIRYEVDNTLPAQKALLERQTKGFDDDAKQKLLKQTLDSWSVAYSVAQDANSIPDTIKVNVIDSVMKNAMDNLLITKTNDPLGEI